MGKAIQGGAINFYDFTDGDKLSPRILINRETRAAKRRGHIAYSDIDALILECFPTAPAAPGAYPGVSYLYADSLEIAPLCEEGSAVNCAGDVAVWTNADVTIGYSTLPYTVSERITRRYSHGAEILTMPANSVRWESQAVGEHIETEDVQAGKLIPTIEHAMTFHRVTSIPWAAIRDNIGCVNIATYESIPAECLLFLGAEVSFVFSTDGTQVWTLEYHFSERNIRWSDSTEAAGESSASSSEGFIATGPPFGWNHFWRPSHKRWERVLDDDGNRMYSGGTFSGLFSG